MMLPDLSPFPVIACDAETTGLSWVKDELFGLAFAWREGLSIKSIYVDVREPNKKLWAADQLKRARRIVNHNIKFDQHFWREAGFKVDPTRCECTMIRAALIDEHRRSHSLDSICKDQFGRGKDDTLWAKLAAMFGGEPTLKAQIQNLPLAPEELVARYASTDAELALMLWEWQETKLERQQLMPICKIEHELLIVVMDMEYYGTPVDLETGARRSVEVGAQIKREQLQLNHMVGRDVNVNSGPQVAAIVQPVKDAQGVWRAKDGTMLEDTDGGGPSIRTHALHNMTFPEAELIASIRGLTKAKDVFIDRYVLVDGASGRIHCNINQTKTEYDAGTTTGRFSITEPALQQIHARDVKLAQLVRSLFVPDKGQIWGSFDYSQIDFRCFAHYTREPILIDAYAKDPYIDFHTKVSQLMGIPRDRDEKTGGGNAKQIDLGMVFTMGQGRLCKEMGLPYSVHPTKGHLIAGEEGEALFRKYHAMIPGVRELANSAEARAKKRGYILTPLGRKLHFPNPREAYKASGLLFQAACADIIKYKMIELHRMLRGTDSRLMLTVHDELCVSMGKDARGPDIINLLQRFDGTQTPMQFRVPIVCKLGTGPNWFIATKK